MQNKKNADRGMIKWRPFASLPEHMELVEKKLNAKNKQKKIINSYDKLVIMNEIVENSIKNSTKIVLKLYKNGEYLFKDCIAISFDFENKVLIVKNGTRKEYIKIIDIVDVYEK